MMVVEGDSKGLGLAHTCQGVLELATRMERRPQGKSEIDRLLTRGAGLWQMSQGEEGLLEVRTRLPVSRPRHGLLSGLLTIRESFGPYVPSHGMVRESLDLIRFPPAALDDGSRLGVDLGCERLECLDDLPVQQLLTLQQSSRAAMPNAPEGGCHRRPLASGHA